MIYICIPAHNEEQTVGVVLWKVRQVMAELARDYQLLVADDGSSDRTPSVLDPYTRVLPLTVLRNDSRRGYAASLEMLLREAVRRSEYPRRDVIVPLQADFTEDPQHVATLIRRIESGADIVASATVYGGVPPRRAYRWGRMLMNRLLRRFSWPDGVRDPLAGLHAYRVATVKGALDARPGQRLLQFEGWAANAQLLRDAAPHARRVEAIELVTQRERLQRPERFHFGTAFREVLALVRGRPTATTTVEQIQPDAVLGGRSQLRALTVEGLRADGVINGGGPPTRARRSHGGRGTGDRKKAGAGKRGERPRESGAARGERTRKERPEGERRGRTGAPAAEGRDAGVVEPAARNGAAPAADDQRQDRPPKKRRGRRGGSRRNKAGAPGGAPEGTSETAEAGSAPVTEAATAGAEGAGDGAMSGARKRRRGSRGGRRRRTARPESQGTNENQNESPPPPDAAAAG